VTDDVQTTRYASPATIAEAVGLLQADPGAHVFAGGTDLIVQARAGRKHPTAFVDLKRIPELMAVTVDRRGARIGAAVPGAVICEHPDLRRVWPGLVEAVHLIGSAQIQGRGSLGGNLCNASPAADTTCPLLVNRARALITGPEGERIVDIDEFTIGPGRTVLGQGELLVALLIPYPAPRTSDAYLRLIPRTEMDIAVAGAAVSVTLDAAGTCTAARVAIGAVAPTARLVLEAADALVGTRLDPPALARAAAAARSAAQPIDDARGTASYRRQVVGVLTARAAALAGARARTAS